MSAFMKITRNEIEQVTEQVVDLMGHEGSKGMAITWRLFGDSGDYLAISEVIAMLLGRNWVTNGSYFASSVQSVFYRNPSMIDDDKKPQMNADERRYLYVMDFGKTTHRKGRKERKAVQQESLRPLRSLRLNVFSAPAHERAPHAPAVHPRLSRAGG